MAIEDWMPELKSKLGEITGIEEVHGPDDLPDSILISYTLIVMPFTGNASYGAGSPALNVHYLRATLYGSGALLQAHGELVPFIDRVRRKLAANLQLGGFSWNNGAGKIQHVLPYGRDGVFYDGPGGLTYNGEPRAGIHFFIEVKESDPLTVSP